MFGWIGVGFGRGVPVLVVLLCAETETAQRHERRDATTARINFLLTQTPRKHSLDANAPHKQGKLKGIGCRL